jgi:hypothetical protein
MSREESVYPGKGLPGIEENLLLSSDPKIILIDFFGRTIYN